MRPRLTTSLPFSQSFFEEEDALAVTLINGRKEQSCQGVGTDSPNVSYTRCINSLYRAGAYPIEGYTLPLRNFPYKRYVRSEVTDLDRGLTVTRVNNREQPE